MQYRIKQTMFGENQLCVLHQSKRKINLRYQKISRFKVISIQNEKVQFQLILSFKYRKIDNFIDNQID